MHQGPSFEHTPHKTGHPWRNDSGNLSLEKANVLVFNTHVGLIERDNQGSLQLVGIHISLFRHTHTSTRARTVAELKVLDQE